MTDRLRGGVCKGWLYLSYLKVCVKETPAIRLHHAFKHLITPRALIIRPHLGNESVIKPQERSRTRVLSNTSRQKHFWFQCSPRKFLHFFSHIFLLDDYGKRKLTRIFLGEARISTYNIISTCRLSSKISFIVIRLPTTIRNIVGRKKGCHSIVMCPTVWFYSH